MRCSLLLWMLIGASTAPLRVSAEEPPLVPAASFWDYGSLCSPKAIPDEPLTIKVVTDLRVGQSDCAQLSRRWGTPAAVRVRFVNGGGGEATLTLGGLSSVVLRGPSGSAPALGVLWRSIGTGSPGKLSPADSLEGSVAFPLAVGKALDLVFFFSRASKGDALAFGELTPVPVEGEPPLTTAPAPARLETSASLWSGTVCDTVPKKPQSMTFGGGTSLAMVACPGVGQVVRVEIANAGGRAATVTLRSLESLRLKRPGGAVVSASGFGMSTPNPIGKGTNTMVANELEGELGFLVEGGQSFDLLILFSKATVGDIVSVGDAPPAAIKPRQ
jgi:hypothetical protein